MKSSKSFYLILSILLVTFLPHCVNAQGWEWQNPYPNGNSFTDVKFVNDSVGWAISGSMIYHTSDRGMNWIQQNSENLFDLMNMYSHGEQIYCTDTNNCWIVGNSGTILHTSNGGVSWVRQSCNTIHDFTGITFSDSLHGWAYFYSNFEDNSILRTTNGGINWTNSTFSMHATRGLIFFNTDIGLAIGTNNRCNILIRSTDGGVNWTSIDTTQFILEIGICDSSSAWTFSSQPMSIRHTTDRGVTWQEQTCGLSLIPKKIIFTDLNNGWALYSGSTIYHTTDGGSIWNIQTQSSNSSFYSMSFINANQGWIVGNAGTILRTINGGIDWNIIHGNRGINLTLRNIVAFNRNNLLICSDSGLVRTSNAGMNWVLQPGVNGLYNMQFIDSIHGVALQSAALTNTTDGGITWNIPNLFGYVNEIYFVNVLCGWAVGSEPIMGPHGSYLGSIRKIYMTSNGGISWTVQWSSGSGGIVHVTFSDSHHGWVISNDGDFRNPPINHSIWHTNNGGSIWYTQYSGSGELSYSSITCIDSSNVWVAEDNRVLHSTNGGENWAIQNTETTNHLKKIKFIDCNNGWVIGTRGTIFHTTNGGDIWNRQSSGTSNDLSDVAFIDANNGWIVGASGTILHTSNGGEVYVEETPSQTLPTQFVLHSSYPNPFNATTTISYELPKAETIDLKIFDLQGRLVQSLFSGHQRAGSYRTTFDGSGLASGTYFVRLQAGMSVQTQKIILLK